jgi:hypothetical protein
MDFLCEQAPDVVGLTQEEGSLLLRKHGLNVKIKSTYHQNINTNRIIRQRAIDTLTIELIISDEYCNDPTNDPTIEEKEV